MNLQENILRVKELMKLILEKEISEISNSKVDYVFDNNPELLNIGTKDQYLQYLGSIFTDSKIKDIMFHSSENKFLQFKDPSSSGLSHVWFSEEPLNYQFGPNVYSVVLNIKNPLNEQNPNYDKEIRKYEIPLNPDWINNFESTGELPKFEYDGTIRSNRVGGGKSVTVRNPNQIHILGSEQDMKQFKNFINTSSDSGILKNEI
jgi:hypothetical protein